MTHEERASDAFEEIVTSPGGIDQTIAVIANAIREAVDAERERCAKVCEQLGDLPQGSSEGYEYDCAARIREGTQ